MTKIDTHLAGILDTAGDSASYDAACKRLLANKVILAWIMKSCMEEYRNCSIEEIASCILRERLRSHRWLCIRMNRT